MTSPLLTRSRLALARPATWARTCTRQDPLRIRFEAKTVQAESGCWEWTGAHAANGYAQIGNAGRVLYAHRVAYELFVGPIPAGLHIDHLCDNRGCVRPMHLEAVTQAENNRRVYARGRRTHGGRRDAR